MTNSTYVDLSHLRIPTQSCSIQEVPLLANIQQSSDEHYVLCKVVGAPGDLVEEVYKAPLQPLDSSFSRESMLRGMIISPGFEGTGLRELEIIALSNNF